MGDIDAALAEASTLSPGAIVARFSGKSPSRITVAGHVDMERSAVLAPDAIFRISSMTKPITAVALMMLIERLNIELTEPVAKWLPELGKPKVLVDLHGELDLTVPAKREITVEDILTSRLGTGIVPAAPGSTPFQREVTRQQLVGFDAPRPAAAMGPDEWLRRLGALPLLAHPGDRWFYSVASNVQGVLIARLSGMALSEFLATHVFEPLEMKDTGFYVKAGQLSRLTPAYFGDLRLADGPKEESAWANPPAFEGGEGGLVSTAADYMAFVRMLHAGGETPTGRLLGKAWIRRMLTDHLTAGQRADAASFLDGRGWGYGVSVDAGRPFTDALRGTVGWSGGLGTSWLSDLSSHRAVVVMCSRALDEPAVHADHQALQLAALR
ncbi:beta-lactamase family protein [Achromobacter pestifer]|uniref:Beta-lactamase family protein n=1 Tax=Achromobacter pestifer TaxID=1353889 RepID=A0A7D4IPW7_9BURK|nr:serine hydrolase domain-containing protein [Achromobacter pestifer]QKH38364.1 beta-lactamase family protein [Achromobacter pestifer]